MTVLYYSKAGNAEALARAIAREQQTKGDQIPPAYPCEAQKLLLIGLETNKAVDKQVNAFVRDLNPNRTKNVAFFCAGCLMGVANDFRFDLHDLSMYVLYALMFQVGIGIGSNKKLKELVKSLRPKMLLVPMATIVGTLLFSAFASLLLSQWSVFDCMAVGSGFAYYSLSSILITQFKEPSIGLQLATELGTIALLANISREILTLLAAPLLVRWFGNLAPISAGGATTMDTTLPIITRTAGQQFVVVSIFHGFVADFSVPFLVTLFCSI